MVATVLAILLTLMLFAVLIAVCLVTAAKSRMPVKFENIDEQDSVYSAARWAAKQLDIKAADRRLRYSLLLWLYSGSFSWLGSIPTQELAVLSPFIDLMIDGKGPPLNLPAEYADKRPARLQRFKKRMQNEGLWPQSEN